MVQRDLCVNCDSAYSSNFCSNGHGIPDCAFVAKYSRALNVLRDELDDPDKAHSSETLRAIMLLMIIQVCKEPCVPVFLSP